MNMCQSLTEALQVSSVSKQQIVHIKSEAEEVTVTYRQLYQNACDILAYLQSRGLQPADELIIAVEDNELFLNIFWACLLGKIIPVPVAVANNDEHRLKIVKIWMSLRKPYLIANQRVFADLETIINAQQLAEVAESFQSRVLFVHGIEKMSQPCTLYHALPEDIALIQFSSGSTGDPKGVVLTHQNLLINIRAIIDGAQLAVNDVMLSWMPLTHDMGLIGFHLTPLVCGINQYNMATSLFIRRPVLWLDKASRHRATVLSSPNFGYKYFLAGFTPRDTKDWDLSPVRLIFNGAEPISAELCNSFLAGMSKYGLKKTAMYPVYGLAEASLAVTFPPLAEEIKTVVLDRSALRIEERVKEAPRGDPNGITFVDVGYPINGCRVRVCGSKGNVLGPEMVGLIEIKGGNVTSGYYNDPLTTATAISEDGWLNTGDLGFFHKGRLVITGRVKDVIFINGLNYYSHDIESIAKEAVGGRKPGEIAACGIFNANKQSEEIIIFVRFKRELQDFVPLMVRIRKYLSLKMGLEVKAIIPVKKIPKTTSGKLMRFKLKAMYQNGVYIPVLRAIDALPADRNETGQFLPNNDSIAAKLLEVWSELFANKIPGVDDNLFEIIGDSLLIAKFCVQIERRKIAKLSIVDLFSYPSIRKLAGFIASSNSGDRKSLS
jgi:acyl-CoA synthetase (AMP-forming)/AMP-acid ligase II